MRKIELMMIGMSQTADYLLLAQSIRCHSVPLIVHLALDSFSREQSEVHRCMVHLRRELSLFINRLGRGGCAELHISVYELAETDNQDDEDDDAYWDRGVACARATLRSEGGSRRVGALCVCPPFRFLIEARGIHPLAYQ